MKNVRVNRRGNQEWTIQRNWRHWVHKTQDENKCKKSLKEEQHRSTQKEEEVKRGAKISILHYVNKVLILYIIMAGWLHVKRMNVHVRGFFSFCL